MIKKHHVRRKKIKKIIRMHAVFLVISFGLYVVLSALFGPEFILSDVRHKFSALADNTITINSKVLAPPVAPIVSATAICDNGSLSVNLDWPEDENTETYSIDRNELPLVSGITDSAYIDTNLTINTSYIYSVTAFGPMGPGNAVSQSITVTTQTECAAPKPVTAIKIISFENKDISKYGNSPKTTSRYPSFSGTTTIPNAKIDIILESGPIVYGATTANINGFWEWSSPELMDFGSHTLFVTTIDPDDTSNTDTAVFYFRIVRESTDKENVDEDKKNPEKIISKINPASPLAPSSQAVALFKIVTSIENSDQIVFSGNELLLRVDLSKKSFALTDKDYEFFYTIFNSKNDAVLETSENINVLQTESKLKKISIPTLTPAGNYKIQVKTYDGRDLIVSDSSFQVKELPVMNIGSTTITLVDVMRSLSWIIIALLLTTLSFLALLGIEHHLSEQALFQITEYYLRRKGFFTKRKGVSG